MQVAAYTSGRSQVAEYDCLLLRHILWQRPEEAERIYDWLLRWGTRGHPVGWRPAGSILSLVLVLLRPVPAWLPRSQRNLVKRHKLAGSLTTRITSPLCPTLPPAPAATLSLTTACSRCSTCSTACLAAPASRWAMRRRWGSLRQRWGMCGGRSPTSWQVGALPAVAVLLICLR